MLEIYEIVWRNKDVTGYLEYNTKTDKFQAYLKAVSYTHLTLPTNSLV